MLIVITFVLVLHDYVCKVSAQHGYISLNARALSETQVLVSRYDVGSVELANLDFAVRRDGESRWRTTRFNPTREYFAYEYLNSSTLYYFRLQGRQMRTYHILHAYTHIRTPPYTQQPPANVTAVTQSDGSVHVTWSPELDGRVLGYLVIYTEVDSTDRSLNEYKVKPVFRTTQTTLRDISGSSRYKVEVASVSLDGEGLSKQSIFIGREKEPDPTVSDVRARAIDSSSILVTWKLVQPPGATVYRGVDVEYREMTDDGRVVQERIQRYFGRGSSVYIRQLNSGTTYQVQVLARTSTASYVPSDVVKVTTDPEIPEAPYNLRTTRVAHSEIDFKWETRTPLERLSGFSVFVLDVAKGREVTHRLDPATDSTFSIPDLQEDTEYQITVSSWIRGDEGNRSDPLPVRTSHFAPDPPPNVKGESINATSIWVTWALPEDRYARSYIIGHHVQYEELFSSTPYTKSKTESVVGKDTQVVLTSLSENTTYKVQVRAYTIHTEGKLSAPIRVKTLVSPQPVDLTPSLVSHNSVHVTWDAPVILRDITGFNVYVRDTTRGRQTKTRIPPEKEHTITGLQPDSRYVIRVSSNYKSRESDLSQPLAVVTLPYVPPPPTNILASPVNETAVLVEWSTIKDPLVVSYHVTWEETDQRLTAGQNVRVKQGKALISALKEDTSYRVRVRAETATQNGVYSKPITVTTLESDKPIGLRASNTRFNQAELSWYAPIKKRDITAFQLVLADTRTGAVTRETLPSKTQYLLTGLYPDTEYTVTLRSRMGSKRGKISDEYHFRTLAFVPDAPVDVLTVPVNDTAIMVTWIPTLNDETKVYVVLYYIAYNEVGGTKEDAVKVNADTDIAFITYLTADTPYRVRVRAETLTEKGRYSHPSRVKTMKSDKPQQLKTTQVKYNQAEVSWRAPVSERNITGFQLLLSDLKTGERTQQILPPKPPRYTIMGLEPDRMYSLTIKSLLENIEGKTSDVLEFKTLPYIPEAPVDVVATPVHDTAVMLRWTPTVTDANRRYVVRYHIAYNKRGGKELLGDVGSVEVAGDADTAVITSLTADTSYRIQVRAETLTEDGEYSQPEAVKTLKSDKPTKLKTSRMKFNQAVVSWYAPTRDRSITGFDLVLTDVSTRGEARQSIPVASRHVLTGLEPDRMYKLTVTSLLDGKPGKTSDVLDFRTLPFVPKAPRNILTTTLNDTAVQVEWTPTVDDDTRRYIVRYHIAYSERDGEDRSIQVPGNAVSGVITSLDADTSYTVRVRAETQTEKGEFSAERIAKTFVSERPHSLTTTDLQFNQAEISWYAPVVDRNITGFQIEVSDLTTGEIIRETLPSMLVYTQKGLEPDRKYKVHVTSLLRGAVGKRSNVLEFKTLPFIPKAPVSVVATPIHDTALRITWIPTVDDDTRRYIVRYNIAYNERDNRSATERSVQVGKDDVTVDIDSLVADTNYRVRVRAETSTEEGEYSQPVVVKTLESDKPQSLKTTRIDFNQADVSWYAPIRDRDITGFQLVLSDVTTGESTPTLISPTSRHTIKGLEPDRGYTLTVKSVLADFEGKTSDVLQFRTIPYVPEAPVDVIAIPIHDTALRITWTPTVDNDTRRYIVRYNIAYNEQGSGLATERSVQVGKDDVTVDIDSLVADTNYRVRVRAETSTEEGEYSQPVVVKTLESDKPQSLKTTRIDFNQADVSWYAPIRDRDITGFQLVLSDVTTGESTPTLISPTSRHTLKGLEPDRGYTLTVKSVLAEFEGKTSDVLEFRTIPYVPKAPVDVIATPIHDTAIRITWTPTVDDDTRGYIVHYNIAYNEQDSRSATERNVQVGKDDVSVDIDSLVADTNYRVRVRAETSTEEGEYSQPVVVKTLVTDKPRSLRTTGLQFNQADVSWYAPISARDITGFDLVLTDVTTGEITHTPISPTSRYTFTRLKPDRGYTLTVKSILAEFEGKTSDVLEFRTLPYVPEAPANVVVIPLHDTALQVTWTPTVDDQTRAYVVRYHISYNELNVDELEVVEVAGDATKATIAGLVAETSYRVRVRAETPTEEGQYSEAIISNTLESDKPQSLRTSGIEFNEVEVAWYAAINARNITGFRLELTDGITGEVRSQDIQTISRYLVQGLEPDRQYSFTVTSLFGDEVGKTSDVHEFTTLPFIPDAPANIIMDAINDTALQLTWTPTVNDDTRRYVINYDITYGQQGTRQTIELQTAGDVSSTIIGALDPDTTYGARVRAVTATEEGQLSQLVLARTHESDKPRELKAFGIKFDRADLSWYAPIAQRGITGFLLVLNDLITNKESRFTIPAVSRYTLTKLIAEHTYTVTLTSMFGEVEGKTSEQIQFETLPFIPEAPEDILLTALNDTAVVVEWTPPVTEDTKAYVVRYYIAYNEPGQSERVKDRDYVEAAGDAALAFITGLDANTNYRVRVRAETHTQKGALSQATTVRTLESDKPRGLKALNIQFDQAEISWYAPTEQRNITSFVFNLRDHETGEVTHQVGSGKTRQSIMGLKADRQYTLTVTSMLGDQVGKTSDELEFQTKPFVPKVIQEVSVAPLNQSTILVQWKNPDDAGSREYITKYRVEYGEVDRYRRVQNPSSLEYRGQEGREYVTGLNEDTDYRIRVRAETDTQRGVYTRAYLTKTLMSEQPRNLAATDVTYSSITVSWTAPIEQRNITSFNVYTFDTIEGEENRYQIPPKLNFRIDNLRPDRAYGIRVSAMIGEQEGQSSNNIEVRTNPFIPRAPTDVKSHPVNASAVYVEWNAPDDLFAREYVIGFNILYDKSRSKLPIEKWGLLEHYGHKENFLITSLEPDTVYNVMVRVNTKTEKGDLSIQIAVKTMVSAEPMNLMTPRVTFDQFDLTWEAPIEERNISGFAVYLTDRTVNGRTREEIDAIETHTFEDLTPSTVYLAEVASILDTGEGIVSAPISVETMPFVPEAPTSVQATSYNFSSITFDWQLAKDPASLMYIKGCHVLYTKTGEGSVTKQQVLLGQAESVVLSTLEEDSTYRVQIRAFSDTAEGNLSRPVIISTPPAVPDWSPELLTATVEYDTSVRLEWYVQSPKAQLDQTLKYEVQYFRQPDPYGDMYVDDLLSGPTIIDNLETHSTYAFKIRAYSFTGPGPWSNSLEATLDGPDLSNVKILRTVRNNPFSSRTRWVQLGVGSVPIKGFRIYYTPINYKFEPVRGQRFINSVGVRTQIDNMRSLRPQQYYFVQVAAFSDEGIGRRSDVSFLPDMDYPRIATGPKNKKIAAKLAVTFSCEISGEPDYTVYWKKGDVRILKRHTRFEFKMVNNTSILRIKQARPGDTAEYTCVLDVNGTLYTRSSKLDVYDQTEIPSGYPSFTRNPSLTSVETGSNTSFICAANGIPIPTISWYKNNVPIKESRKFVVTQIEAVSGVLRGRESRLWVLNATLEDVGKYVCSAENIHGTIYNFDAQLYVKLKRSAPVFIEVPEDLFIEPGSDVNLTCVTDGEPIPTVRWLQDGAYMDIAEMTGDRTDLILSEVYVSAVYTCEATNSEGQTTSTAKVEVDSTSKFKGIILQEPRNRTVIYGSYVSFHCGGTGNPKPNIYWERNGERLSREDFDQSYYMEQKGDVSVLEIGRVVKGRDQGEFSCTVENNQGYTEAAVTLTVLKRNDEPPEYPEITKHPSVTAVARGESTGLFCASNDVNATISWYKDRFILTSTKRVTISTEDGSSELRIKKAAERDYGKYHCSVDNEHGIAYSKRVMLYIRRVRQQR